jgi:hypothetical protein
MKKNLSRIIKMIGMPLLFLASPISQVSSRIQTSGKKTTKTFISTRARSGRRSHRKTYIDRNGHFESLSGSVDQAFNSFNRTPVKTIDDRPETKVILGFLSKNNLLVSMHASQSSISGNPYRKSFAHVNKKDHCHYSTYSKTSTGTSFHTTYSGPQAECGEKSGYDWDFGAALFTGPSDVIVMNDNETIFPFETTDIIEEYGETVDVTVDIGDSGKGDLESTTSPNTFSEIQDGVYTISDPSDDAQAALHGLKLTPASVTSGSFVNISFALKIEDANSGQVVSKTVEVRVNAAGSANDPPTITGAIADQAVDDTETLTPFSGITISDTENVSIIVTLDTQAKGSFTTLSGFIDNSDGSYSLASGSAADATTAIQGLVLKPAENRVAVGETETIILTIAAGDGTNTTTDNTTTVISTSVNVAPPAPELASPADGLTVPSPVTLSWNSVIDSDGDTVTFWVSLCENDTFSNCVRDPQQYVQDGTSDATGDSTGDSAWISNPPWTQMAHAADGNSGLADKLDFESWIMMLVLLGGLSLTSLAFKERRRYLIVLFLIFFGLANCSGGDSGSGESNSEGNGDGDGAMSMTIPGLISGQTYYWKVTTKDGVGGETDSQVYHFTVE